MPDKAPDLTVLARPERIFERFVGRRSSSNHGLGLYIVCRFAQAMGGDVEVSSRLGHGASFRVILPAAG